MDGTAISYDAFDMQTANVITSDIGDAPIFERNLGVQNRIRKAGAIITDDTFETKVIPTAGYIEDTSDTLLEGRIDDFNAAMAKKNKQLDIGYEGGTRRYIATPQRVSVTRPVRAANWAKFEVDFLVTEFGKNTSATTLLSAVSTTASPKSHAIVIDGNAPQQSLLITLTLTSFTGASINTLTLKNNDTGQAISVSRKWVAGDVLVVDVDLQKVTVNGVVTDFSGAFPSFEAGNRTLVYSDDFTARNVSVTASYVKRWL